MSWEPPEEIHVRWDLPQDQIDPDALKVVGRLRRFGYTAYLVGGCVRDLYLGLKPKDFDVVTSARPNELRRVFRNCRIIGRRFRLAHVVFGGKIIEVSTFRANVPAADFTRDLSQFNVFGSPQEDALRRDFTVNALFYEPHTREIIDYVGGARDLQNGLVRSIGPAHERFVEDPVRMIRALKLAGRMGFELHPDVENSLTALRDEVGAASPARVLEELFKILASGTSERIIWLLHRYRILHALLPELAGRLPPSSDEDCLLWHYLRALDALDRGRRALGNATLLGAFLVPLLDPAGHLFTPGGGQTPDLGYVVTRTVRHSGVLRHLPRRDLYLLVQLQTLMRRLATGHVPGPLLDRLIGRETFADTLFLFWIASRALGLDPAVAGHWESIARRRRPDMAWVLDGTSREAASPPSPRWSTDVRDSGRDAGRDAERDAGRDAGRSVASDARPAGAGTTRGPGDPVPDQGVPQTDSPEYANASAERYPSRADLGLDSVPAPAAAGVASDELWDDASATSVGFRRRRRRRTRGHRLPPVGPAGPAGPVGPAGRW